MWSGRFREPLDAEFERWQRSFPFDWRLLREELAASAAHAKMLADAGILTPEELERIEAGLQALALVEGAGEDLDRAEARLAAWGRTAPLEMGTIEDIHHYVEAALTERIGPVALKLHTGRSRNEQVATDLRLFTRHACDRAVELLGRWTHALLAQAEAAGEHSMPAYTHMQRAEPVLVAHWLMAYVAMAERDMARLGDCRSHLNVCPLGSGPVAGATLRLDREIAARELGFDAPTANSMDATSDRDFALEFAQVALQTGLHLSRFAEEITLFSTAEYGFVDLPERFSTGSSAMPQKKNPDLTELLRGKTGRLAGAATALATQMKGLPLAYNKDMQETQEALFDSVDTLLGSLRIAGPFTGALRFRYDRMRAAASTGYLNAMAAATYLVGKGVAFRTAHERIGALVRYALNRGIELEAIPLSALREFGEEFDEGFYRALTMEATLDCHDVVGGTARARVRRALREAQERLGAVREPESVATHGL